MLSRDGTREKVYMATWLNWVPYPKRVPTFVNKSWIIVGTMIVEEYLTRKVLEGEDRTYATACIRLEVD